MPSSLPPGIAPDLASLIRLQHGARGFSFQPGQPVRSLLAGRRASRIRGRGLSFEEIRAYRPGDDVRMMDWRATARTGRAQTRVFTEERDRPVLLVVELTPAMFFGTVRAVKSVVAAEAAALAAWRCLAGGDRIGAVLFGDDGVETLRPTRSRVAVMRLLSSMVRRATRLARTPPSPASSTPLNAALAQAEALAPHGTLVVVVFDLLSADAGTAAAARRIARHNDIVAIPISDPLERRLPDAPWRGIATDGGGFSVLDPAASGLGPAIASGFAQRLARLNTAGQRSEIPVLPLGTEADTAEQLRRQLGRQARRRR
ncbi:DUF58 domain-containing protein [Roseomonas aerophila]|uniref:DUF58 domain-containing protein n=1 Tax=Teichococcus aerophilus TaxID=1224513 RepID=A0ABR7RLN0_9PROT|nr:DUF58 domain-containing protein [Pseudoroseomonas aerophila]MBC9207452.1 DUF58 domain-containing protein [Pseudoroseomonas aerophila]